MIQKRCIKDRPEIGTKMYLVCEHLYYIPNRAGPLMEYCVCEAEVRGYFEGGHTEICLIGEVPGRGMTPHFYMLKDVGARVFYTPHEAAELAKSMTDKYERTWGWTGDPPMRRPWEHLLEKHCEEHG